MFTVLTSEIERKLLTSLIFFFEIYFIFTLKKKGCRCLWRPEESIRSSGVRITGSSELPGVSAGT